MSLLDDPKKLAELFRKYINHVAYNEGTSFIDGPHVEEMHGFTREETAVLQLLDREAPEIGK